MPESTDGPEVEGELARFRRDRLALWILVLGAVVRGLFVAETAWVGLDNRSVLNLDTYMHDRMARRVADGDVLMLDRYEFSSLYPDAPGFPRSNGAIQILGLERYDREFGPFTYAVYPGYPYFVAAFYRLFGAETRTVFAAQALLDWIACALVYLVARRAFDRTTARVALGLACATGPLVFYTGFLLRESVLASLLVIVVYLAQRARDEGSGPGTWAACGVAYGIAWVIKSSDPILPPILAWNLLQGAPALRPLRRVAGRAAAFALGVLIPTLPVMQRNVALGVPPLRTSTGEFASLILFNVPEAGVRGLRFDFDTARAVAASCSKTTPLAGLRAAISVHASPGAYATLVATRVANHLIADDAWDDVRVSYLSPCLRSLRLAPVRWKLIAPWALLGGVLALGRLRDSALVLAPVALALFMAAIGCCLTRYRLVADHEHAVLAASGFVWTIRAARARRGVALLAAGAVLATAFVLHDPVPLPAPEEIAAHVRRTFGTRTAHLLLEGSAR